MYFWNKTLHVSDSFSVYHQQFFTVHAANLHAIYHCCMYSEKHLMMDRRNWPKRVEFYTENKFEKLVYLVGFIIRMSIYNKSTQFQRFRTVIRIRDFIPGVLIRLI